jgi:DUF1680 family protein
MSRRILLLAVVFTLASVAFAESPKPAGLASVPFPRVKLQDSFWAPRLETNRLATLPHNLEYCRKTGRIDNFAKAAGLMPGKFEGFFFNDSDLYKVIEGAAHSLAAHPDPALEKEINEIITKIAASQQKDGYLNTYFILKEPEKRWSDIRTKHELYCAGHLIEAAVAHYNATGKRTLLDVAEKLAEHIDGQFGPGKRLDPPGHEEIELALIKLYRLTGKEKYLRLAENFINARGNPAREKLWGPYFQDHAPLGEQNELVGHAVRAMYLCCGATDLAAHTGETALLGAMDRLWDSLVQRKMYVTGGIGARRDGEAFGADYELPNDTAYCETCAAIGVAFWAHRMNLLKADAQYADVLERAIYNGFLSGVALDGKHFFYVNPLESDGKHHRKEFYDCACCPTNVVRFMPALPGYFYAIGESDGKREVYVNLYAEGETEFILGDNKIHIEQKTKYPWDGKVALTIKPDKPAELALCLRIPGWCRGATLSVDGEQVAMNVEKGYARLQRQWQSGDRIELNLPMPVERIEAHPRVAADRGRVAVCRGPLVYCFEAVDNDGAPKNIVLPADPKFQTEYRPDLLGGTTVIMGVDKSGRKIVAVPYHAWDNRAAGEMIVWMPQESKTPDAPQDDSACKATLYRRWKN